MRTQFRKIFTSMGFEEMPTNNYVESSFWNFDALFQPQQHPARDAHDTFFLTGWLVQQRAQRMGQANNASRALCTAQRARSVCTVQRSV